MRQSKIFNKKSQRFLKRNGRIPYDAWNNDMRVWLGGEKYFRLISSDMAKLASCVPYILPKKGDIFELDDSVCKRHLSSVDSVIESFGPNSKKYQNIILEEEMDNHYDLRNIFEQRHHYNPEIDNDKVRPINGREAQDFYFVDVDEKYVVLDSKIVPLDGKEKVLINEKRKNRMLFPFHGAHIFINEKQYYNP